MKENKCDCGCINTEHIKLANKLIPSLPIGRLVNFYKAFGDETRLKIICVLDEVGEMCVCDIAYSLDMTKSAISHQLKYLRDIRLLTSRKEGKEVYYRLADEHIRDLYEIGLKHIEEDV
ncbi:MAG: helix-turn-helix transcriptional regulator [Clostridiales bacterium]|nr:helix-turn-helix transcriptional regulator [Clostridiales bacterium]